LLEVARGAKDKHGGCLNLLGVTVLTSFDEESWGEVSPGCPLSEALSRRAALCAETGMDGIVCAPPDLPAVRSAGKGLLTVVPGIRPVKAGDDQVRVTTPQQAMRNGADYIVVGRPIVNAPDRVTAAVEIAGAIEEGLR
jgi:orotidine-5'-phosphate decarboxylase